MTYKQILRRRAIKNQEPRALAKLWPYQIVIAPVFTEKSIKASEDGGKYYFRVHTAANKIDVKKAIEHVYNVEVKSVNIQNVPHKGRSMRKTVRKPYKKAIVTLKGEQKIEIAW